MGRLPTIIFAYCALITACAPRQVQAPNISGGEELRALDAAYVNAWLIRDPAAQQAAVLTLFEKNAVIMPGEGLAPEKGVNNLKDFWFPPHEPPTEVSHFTHEIGDVDISGELGVVSGRYALGFDYGTRSFAQKGSYLFVARRSGGKWKILRMIWNDQPLTDV